MTKNEFKDNLLKKIDDFIEAEKGTLKQRGKVLSHRWKHILYSFMECTAETIRESPGK